MIHAIIRLIKAMVLLVIGAIVGAVLAIASFFKLAQASPKDMLVELFTTFFKTLIYGKSASRDPRRGMYTTNPNFPPYTRQAPHSVHNPFPQQDEAKEQQS